MKDLIVYGARDTSTGKLVSDLTTPRKKLWEVKWRAKQAIDNYNISSAYYGRNRHGTLELVTFKLVEVADNEKVDE